MVERRRFVKLLVRSSGFSYYLNQPHSAMEPRPNGNRSGIKAISITFVIIQRQSQGYPPISPNPISPNGLGL